MISYSLIALVHADKSQFLSLFYLFLHHICVNLKVGGKTIHCQAWLVHQDIIELFIIGAFVEASQLNGFYSRFRVSFEHVCWRRIGERLAGHAQIFWAYQIRTSSSIIHAEKINKTYNSRKPVLINDFV